MASRLVTVRSGSETLVAIPQSLERPATLFVTTVSRGPNEFPITARAEYRDMRGRQDHTFPGEFRASFEDGAGEVSLYFRAHDGIGGSVHVTWT
jgi:hypothetical protein